MRKKDGSNEQDCERGSWIIAAKESKGNSSDKFALRTSLLEQLDFIFGHRVQIELFHVDLVRECRDE
jgi:hypothetical protein